MEQCGMVFVSDRLADLARNLGFMPRALAGGEIPCMEQEFPLTHMLECVLCIMGDKRDHLYAGCRRLGISRVVLEDRPEEEKNPADLQDDIRAHGLECDVVHCTGDPEGAILHMGRILGVEERAARFARSYRAKMQALEPDSLGAGVVILLGIPGPKEDYLLLETPGCAAEKHILQKLGCVNAGAPLMNDEERALEGVQLIHDLSALEEAAPDALVLTGDALTAQKALALAVRKKPELASVPALARQRIFSLPHYCTAKMFSFPEIYNRWRQALGCVCAVHPEKERA